MPYRVLRSGGGLGIGGSGVRDAQRRFCPGARKRGHEPRDAAARNDGGRCVTMSEVKVNRFAASARSVLSRSDVFGGTALAALLIIAAVIALLEPQFFTPSNLLNIG